MKSLVGNTPLLAVDLDYRGKRRTLYAKAENLNMTGSIKDRMALHIVQEAYEKAVLKPGNPIFEATSGNTGIAVAAVGRAMGHPVTIFMPDWMSSERINLMRSLGAQINLVSREQGGFLGSISMVEELAAATKDAFLPRQFANEDNSAAHERTTGPEIWWQLRFRNLTPDAFVAGVGTGGTITGVGKVLKARKPGIHIVAVEPEDSPVLSGGEAGPHKI
ncbi:MAG TPA: cysteine synthase family protein, partial [Gemmatimonadota bacterium]|nr:cysteine synthase family protein [Gemmatimonadota bacterium]